jgi:tetratricopeptide (TPR) repeat protein
MSDKKPKRQRGRAVPAKSATPPANAEGFRRANEKVLQNIGKLLQEREFGSTEEANTYLQSLLAGGGIPEATYEQTPLEQAQELMYEAWEAKGSRRTKLARQALQISPDCADAYVLLAEEAHSPKEAKQLYEQGVQAGERALGPQMFEEDAGHFWGILETRPYMRAREGLARMLWGLGERKQAIAHYQEMLRLNPGDNQGVRYVLATCLLKEHEDEALGKLLAQFEGDGMAEFGYTRALWLFRRQGASAEANAALQAAIKQNAFVPAYLQGKKRLPARLPDYMGFGDENEAIHYAVGGTSVWRDTPGALEWLAGSL